MDSIDKNSIKKLLVRSPNWLGDAVMALPAIKALAENLQPEKICVIARTGLGSLFDRYGFVNEIVEFDKENSASAHCGMKEQGYDAIFLFTNSFRSAWDGWKTGCPLRAGYSGNFRGCLLTHKMDRPTGLHMTDYYLSLVPRADGAKPSQTIDFPLIRAEQEFAAKLGMGSGAIGIPLGSQYGSAKRWPPERLKGFIKNILERSERTVVLFGTDKEEEESAELASLSADRIKNLAGKTTIGEMAAVMDICDWIVANDSGPLHISAALGKKTIALFGATDPGKTAPLYDNVTVLKKDTDCAPCFKRECNRDRLCMTEISAEEVFRVIEK